MRAINKSYAQKLKFLVDYYRLPLEITNYGSNSNQMWVGAIYTHKLAYPVEYMRIKVTFSCVAKKNKYTPERLLEDFISQLEMAFGDYKVRQDHKMWQPTWHL